MKETLHYLLMADHFLFQKTLFGKIKETGLSIGQPKVLDYLKEHDGTTQREIAAEIGRAHVWNSSHRSQSRMPSSA